VFFHNCNPAAPVTFKAAPPFHFLFNTKQAGMKRRVPCFIFLLSVKLTAQFLPEHPVWQLIDVTARAGSMKGNAWIQVKNFNQQVHLLFAQGTKLCYSCSANSGLTWKSEVICNMSEGCDAAAPGLFYTTPPEAALALDLCGKPHILYAASRFNDGPGAMVHLERTGNGWIRDTVETNTGHPRFFVGYSLDMVIDNEGIVHCVYTWQDHAETPVMEGWSYARKDSTGWAIHRQGTGGITSLSLITDLEGNPRCAVTLQDNEVRYLSSRDQGNSWSNEIAPVHSQGPCDLVLSRGCRPILSFTPAGDASDPDHAGMQPYAIIRKTCSHTWSLQPVEYPPSAPSPPVPSSSTGKTELMCDRDGRLNIAYYAHFPGAFGAPQLCYSVSADEGKTLRAFFITALVSKSAMEGHPGIAVTPGYLLVAYMGYGDKPFIARTPLKSAALQPDSSGCITPEKHKVTCGCNGECPPGEDEQGSGGSYFGYGGSYGSFSAPPPVSSKPVNAPVQPDPPVMMDNPPPVQVQGRGLISQGEFDIDADELVIHIWDDHIIDNDVVSLYLNDSVVVNGFMLPGKITEFRIRLDNYHKNFYLVLYADDVGKMPPCTVAVMLRAGGQEKRLHLVSDTKKCGTLKITRME
jgi:hypothetical protein